MSTTSQSLNPVIVTGGSEGIGRELCLLLDKRGYPVVNVDRKEPAYQAAGQIFRQVDLSLPNQVADLENYLKNEYLERGTIFAALVNNAGVYFGKAPGEYLTEERDTLWQVNYETPSRISEALIKVGAVERIVNIASYAAFMPDELVRDKYYAASKATLIRWAHQIANEYLHRPMVFTIAPSIVSGTGIFDQIPTDVKQDYYQQTGDFATPQQVADIVCCFMENGTPDYSGKCFDIHLQRLNIQHLVNVE